MESYDRYGLSRKYVAYGFTFGIVAPAVGIALYFLISLVIIPLTDSTPTTIPVATTVIETSAAIGTSAVAGAIAPTGIPITSSSSSSSYMLHIYAFISIIFLLGLDVVVNRRFDVIYTNMFLYTYLAGYGIYGIYKLLLLILNSFSTVNSNSYESFADVNGTLQQVQQTTQSLQRSVDTLRTATDDTCMVMKGIEQKFLDTAAAPPGGEGTPPTQAEARVIRTQRMPGAIKQWNMAKDIWSRFHGKTPVVECFGEGSLSDLINANQQLNDLLESASVQQIKSLQTSSEFAQSYMDKIAAKLDDPKSGDDDDEESFDNPDPDNIIANSNRLMKRANDVQSKIQGVLVSTKQLKNNYIAMNKTANDPNTVNNLAEKNL